MKAQDDFQRCLAAHQRQSSRRCDTQATTADDPMDAERDALWGDMGTAPDSSMNGIPQTAVEELDDEKDFRGYSGFHRLCALPRNGPLDPQWQNVRRYLSNFSQEDAEAALTSTQKDDCNHTPLHVACFLSPPVDVVKQMIQLCPKSVEIETGDGKDSPLSLACGGFVPAGEDVIGELVRAYPEARDRSNARNETPLHVHIKTMRSYELDPCPLVVKIVATVEAVNIRDDKGHSPLYYLGRAATEAFSFMTNFVRVFSTEDGTGPDFSGYKKCLRIIVSLNPERSSKTLFLRDLLQLPSNLRDVSFEHESTRVVINSIVGRGQYVALLMMDFYVQLSIVVAFTLGCSDRFQNKAYTTVALVGSSYWILKRIISAIGSSEKWSKVNPFHMMTVLHAIILLASSIYLRNNGLDLVEEGESGPWRNILIVNSSLIWMILMGIVCHTLKGFSVFVHATAQIFKQLVNLFLVFLVIAMCFATMFYVSAVDSADYCTIDEESGEYDGDYCTFHDALDKVYSLFFGTLEADDFNVPFPTLVTLFFFNVIVIILLLNIIIAVMSDCYADVSSHAELVFWVHRFELIVDVDAVTNCVTSLFGPMNRDKKPKAAPPDDLGDTAKLSHEWFGRFLHLCKSSKVPKPITQLVTFAVMALWVLVGFCTFGLVWPRSTRRLIFAPSVSDHLAEDESELEVEMEILKGRNHSLADENSRLVEEMKAMQEKLKASRKEST